MCIQVIFGLRKDCLDKPHSALEMAVDELFFVLGSYDFYCHWRT